MKSFFRILRYALPYRSLAILNILFNLLSTLFHLASVLSFIVGRVPELTSAFAWRNRSLGCTKFTTQSISKRLLFNRLKLTRWATTTDKVRYRVADECTQ